MPVFDGDDEKFYHDLSESNLYDELPYDQYETVQNDEPSASEQGLSAKTAMSTGLLCTHG